MLDFYKNSGTTTLEQCVTSLRTQLLSASSLSSQVRPTVIRIEEVQINHQEEVPDEPAAEKEKGKDKSKKKGKKESEPAPEEPKQEIEAPQVERKEIPVEVIYTPQEIEAIINYVTIGFAFFLFEPNHPSFTSLSL